MVVISTQTNGIRLSEKTGKKTGAELVKHVNSNELNQTIFEQKNIQKELGFHLNSSKFLQIASRRGNLAKLPRKSLTLNAHVYAHVIEFRICYFNSIITYYCIVDPRIRE